MDAIIEWGLMNKELRLYAIYFPLAIFNGYERSHLNEVVTLNGTVVKFDELRTQ